MPRFIKKKRVRYPKNFRKKGATTRRPTNFNNRNAMRPSVYPFMRTFENVLALEAPTGLFQATLQDNLVVGHIEVSLNDLPSYTEFQALFNQYKINGLLLKFTPSYQLLSCVGETTHSLHVKPSFKAQKYISQLKAYKIDNFKLVHNHSNKGGLVCFMIKVIFQRTMNAD